MQKKKKRKAVARSLSTLYQIKILHFGKLYRLGYSEPSTVVSVVATMLIFGVQLNQSIKRSFTDALPIPLCKVVCGCTYVVAFPMLCTFVKEHEYLFLYHQSFFPSIGLYIILFTFTMNLSPIFLSFFPRLFHRHFDFVHGHQGFTCVVFFVIPGILHWLMCSSINFQFFPSGSLFVAQSRESFS